jgi:hypothetical protein
VEIWNGFMWLRLEPSGEFSEHDNELQVSI